MWEGSGVLRGNAIEKWPWEVHVCVLLQATDGVRLNDLQRSSSASKWGACSDQPAFSLLPVFLTGSDRIPIYGMSSLRIVIQSTANGEQYLPVAHTCYNLLDLPKYSSKEILSARLMQAIDHYEGFSLAWLLQKRHRHLGTWRAWVYFCMGRDRSIFGGTNNKNRCRQRSLNLTLPVFCEALAGRDYCFEFSDLLNTISSVSFSVVSPPDSQQCPTSNSL